MDSWFDPTREDQPGEEALCGPCLERWSKDWAVCAVREGYCKRCGWWARLLVTKVRDEARGTSSGRSSGS